MCTITTVATDIEERLSLAYVTAVAARAGCQVAEPKVDRNGIDATIRPISGAPVQIDIQLKAVTTNIRINGGADLSFQLDAATYDKLRRTDVQSPQLLVVYEMPSEQDLWLAVEPEKAALQKGAFWVDLRGRLPVTTATTAIHLSGNSLFDHNAIRDILSQAHKLALKGLAWGGGV